MIDRVGPGGLAYQCAHLYLARNLVNSGKVNEANDMLDGLSDSIYPAVRARALLVLADTAIKECQQFLKKFSDSEQVSQVEFLIGKLAYLNKDYTGATGQLDSFQRKYPNSPQIGQAMMLAALGRMSEGAADDAIDRFTEIIRRFPDNDIAARSKLLMGHAQVSEQKYAQALETFRQLIEQYPKSQYVEHAKSFIERLSRISQ